jgi:hypothetical protein
LIALKRFVALVLGLRLEAPTNVPAVALVQPFVPPVTTEVSVKVLGVVPPEYVIAIVPVEVLEENPENVSVHTPTLALVVKVRVFAPFFTVIALEVVGGGLVNVPVPEAPVERLAVKTSVPPIVTVWPSVGLPVKDPVRVAATGGLAWKVTLSMRRVEVLLRVPELRVPMVPTTDAAVPLPKGTAQSFFTAVPDGLPGLPPASGLRVEVAKVFAPDARSGFTVTGCAPCLRWSCCIWYRGELVTLSHLASFPLFTASSLVPGLEKTRW